MAGLFLGASLGAMAALLLTPKSGRKLREDLLADGERLRTKASERAHELRERGERALEKTKKTARQTADGMKDAARELRDADPESLPGVTEYQEQETSRA